MELSVATHSRRRHTVLEVGGEVDVYTAPRLRGAPHRGRRQWSEPHRGRSEPGRLPRLDRSRRPRRRLPAAARSNGSLALVCPHEPAPARSSGSPGSTRSSISTCRSRTPRLAPPRTGEPLTKATPPPPEPPTMSTVHLAFSPDPAYVRTVRLVAAAVARRAGVADELLDEVRLAIGEACSRAVALHRRHGLADLIDVAMSDGGRFTVRVIDRAPTELAEADPGETTGAIMAQVAVETGRIAGRRGRADHRRRLRPARRAGPRPHRDRDDRTARAPRYGCPGRSSVAEPIRQTPHTGCKDRRTSAVRVANIHSLAISLADTGTAM